MDAVYSGTPKLAALHTDLTAKGALSLADALEAVVLIE
jgi:hypothetical protein